MNLSFKKYFACLVFFFFPLGLAYSQGFGLSHKIREYWEDITDWWPVAMAIVISVAFMFSAGDFFGENRDVKKGFTRLFTIVVWIAIVAMAIKYVLSIKLND